MLTEKYQTLGVVVTSAILGAAYDLYAIRQLHDADLSVWGIAFSAVCAAAISGIAGSALSRIYYAYASIHATQATMRHAVGKPGRDNKSNDLADNRKIGKSPRTALPEFQAFDFTFSQTVNSGSLSRAVSSTRMTRVQLQHHLKSVIEHSAIE